MASRLNIATHTAWSGSAWPSVIQQKMRWLGRGQSNSVPRALCLLCSNTPGANPSSFASESGRLARMATSATHAGLPRLWCYNSRITACKPCPAAGPPCRLAPCSMAQSCRNECPLACTARQRGQMWASVRGETRRGACCHEVCTEQRLARTTAWRGDRRVRGGGEGRRSVGRGGGRLREGGGGRGVGGEGAGGGGERGGRRLGGGGEGDRSGGMGGGGDGLGGEGLGGGDGLRRP